MGDSLDLLALYERVFAAFGKGGFQAIIEGAYGIMQMPISLHDSAFNLLAAAPREKIGDVFWDACLETGVYPRQIIMAFHDQGFMEAATKRREPYYVDWGDCAARPRIQGVVRVNGVVEGYITVFCPKEQHTPGHDEATKLLVNACAIEMERNKSRNLSEDPLLKVLMHDLIRGEVNTKEKLDAWRLPTAFRGAFQLCAVEIPPAHAENCQKYLMDILRSVSCGHIMRIDNNTLYILLYALDNKRPFFLGEDSQKRLGTFGARTGVSNRFSDILAFESHKKQAEAALELGELVGPNGCVFRYEDCRFPFLLNEMAKCLNDEEILAPGIRKLAQYDQNYGTAYLNTLEVYVLENGNGKKTLHKLGIHRNTLLYRLQKTEELLSISLEDGNTFAHYYISFYLMKMKQTLAENRPRESAVN